MKFELIGSVWQWTRGSRLAGVGLLRVLLAAAMLVPGVVVAAPEKPAATLITIVEGSATVLDGVRRVAAAPGVILRAGAIVETAADARFLRIEWPDGETLSLGPASKLMMQPPGFTGRDGKGPAAYVLSGWAKYTSGAGDMSQGLVSALFELQPFKGVAVVRVDDASAWVFVQRGSVLLEERQIKSKVQHQMAAGSIFERTAKAAGAVEDRAKSKDLQEVPRPFRDSLPLRYQNSVSLEPTVDVLPVPDYAVLEAWLTAETPVRAGFTRRFRPLLKDRKFRRDLDKHLAEHPEWRPILHPPPPPPPPPPRQPTPYGEALKR